MGRSDCKASVSDQGDAAKVSDDRMVVAARALSVVSASHPRMAKEIGSFWGFPECDDYLAQLAANGPAARGPEHPGFSSAVLSAIRTLQSIHSVAIQ